MSHQQSRQANASLSSLVQVKDLFLEIAVVTTLSTSVLALLGYITTHPVSATEVETVVAETTVEEVTVSDSSNLDSSSVSTSAADLGETLEIHLGSDMRLFNCLTEVPLEAQQYCAVGDGPIVPPETPFVSESPIVPINAESTDRLTFIQVRF